MPLPPKGSPEWDGEVQFYQTADPDSLWQRAKQLGMSIESYTRRMRERGIGKKKFQEESPKSEGLIVNLPPVHLLNFKTPQAKGDEEIAVLLCGDGHAGKITKSFNREIYRDRNYKMFESTMTIISLHRQIYPIRKLVILDDGDNCQGENPFQGSVIGSVEMGSRDQVSKMAAPIWNDLLGSFRQQFDEVEFHGVPGNHGAERLAPATSKLDLMFYDILKAGIGSQDGIKVNIYEDFYALVDINEFRFFLMHADGIPCQQGVPFFSLARRLKALYIQLRGFNYACSGHFHKRHMDEVASQFEYFMCASLVSDDEWALKKLGISSNPSQWLFGVHPRHGVTWRYSLVVDDKFLPEPMS